MSLTPRLDKLEKNYIINGDMRISQRYVTAAAVAVANNTYTLDRWNYNKISTAVHTITQDTDVPTPAQVESATGEAYLFQNSMRLNLTTPDTSIAAGDVVNIRQFIEGYNWAKISQKPFTLSFWVKATTAGTYCVSLTNSGFNRSYVSEYTINATNTWEHKTINVDAAPLDGTWNYSTGIGLRVAWTLASGTDFQTTPNTWQTGGFFSTSNQVNGVNTGATDFRITGVMIVEGTHDQPAFTTFGKTFEEELIACQRYYEKSYDLGASAGAFPTYAGSHTWHAVGATNRPFTTLYFKVEKRVIPTITLYNPNDGNTVNPIWDTQNSTNHGIASGGVSTKNYWLTPSGTPANNGSLYTNWAVDAEL
jgi:hypothetical protein